ncbi:mCG147667 [Mus musculus]|nr:mCG147667 [Mus musculus]
MLLLLMLKSMKALTRFVVHTSTWETEADRFISLSSSKGSLFYRVNSRLQGLHDEILVSKTKQNKTTKSAKSLLHTRVLALGLVRWLSGLEHPTALPKVRSSNPTTIH